MTLRFNHVMLLIAASFFSFVSCQQINEIPVEDVVPQEVISKLSQLGFNPDGIEIVEDGYRIERDIIITQEFLDNVPDMHTVPNMEQYSTNNLVATNGNRNISIYAPIGGKGKNKGFSTTYDAAVNEVISRYNAENLEITFSRATSSNAADIVLSRLGKRDERQGILGSAGFPTANGDPYGQIRMSGVLESSYGLGVNGIATIIAHEVGHCIGFRHTDYFDRSISCGGSAVNEGASNIGANHIPGTPTGATLNAASWMLSCSDGSDRPFNNADQTALDYLY